MAGSLSELTNEKKKDKSKSVGGLSGGRGFKSRGEGGGWSNHNYERGGWTWQKKHKSENRCRVVRESGSRGLNCEKNQRKHKSKIVGGLSERG